MLTIKLKYKTAEENKSLIKDYQRQFSNLVRIFYNCFLDNPNFSQKEAHTLIKSLNNLDLLKSYSITDAYKEVKTIIKQNKDKKIIFGGRRNFEKRLKGNISSEEWKECRLLPFSQIGQVLFKSNVYFRITKDLNICFQPTRDKHILFELPILKKNLRKTFETLRQLQENKQIPITYKLTQKYIYIIYDDSLVNSIKERKSFINNRVFGIDLNPNYIGWSIVDWKNEDTYKVINSGVFSFKELNDKWFDLKDKGIDSSDNKRIKIKNKIKYEQGKIAQRIVKLAEYYGCEIIAFEKLSIKSSNKGKGKIFNSLTNNLWRRDWFIHLLKKYLNRNKIDFIEVEASYSSFLGNLIYRETGFPDMCLSSIEIGRRGNEFNKQYIKKIKEKQKNIIFPLSLKFFNNIKQSLEELNYKVSFKDYKELYNKIKNEKCSYRFCPCLEEVFRKKSFKHEIIYYYSY